MKELLAKLKPAKSEEGGSIQMPPFFKDLYSDLRDRHLLPLVAVLLAAIVAVPFLLKASDPVLSRTEAQATLPDAVPASARLEIVADVPTLRDYRDRLRELVEKDPFQQHFTAPQVEGAQLGTGTSGSTTVPTYEPPPAPEPPAPDLSPPSGTPAYVPPPAPPPAPAPAPPAGGDSDGGDSGDDRPAEVRVETKLVSYRITARLGEPGEIRVRRNIPELTMLPNEKNPVAVFLGVSTDEKKALFLVSSEVTSIFGDTNCRFGDDACQFIAVEPRFPVVFTYGPNDRKFQLSINKIERVEQSAGSGTRAGEGSGDGAGTRHPGAPAAVAGSSSAE